ncbi:hypothetical protein V6Z12_D04G171500 [Gossypium hirsutum]
MHEKPDPFRVSSTLIRHRSASRQGFRRCPDLRSRQRGAPTRRFRRKRYVLMVKVRDSRRRDVRD